jgi:DNA-binding transcriptional MerR regulator
MTDFLSPGQVVERSGFSLDTLRYYERIGLLDRIERGPGGRRRYADEDLEWLGVLRCLRDTGMPIAQMRRYAELAREGDGTIAERMALLVEHDEQVERTVADLRNQQAHLKQKINWYRTQLPGPEAASER